MIPQRDLHTYHEVHTILYGDILLGTLRVEYTVTRHIDTRNLALADSYLVVCSLRTIIPPEFPFSLIPTTPDNYHNYPAILKTKASAIDLSENLSPILLDYEPKSLNSSIEIGQVSTSSSGTEIIRQHTSTSATSISSTIGGGASGGLQMGQKALNLEFDYHHTSSDERSQSTLKGGTRQSSNQRTGSASMTIKDWGSYASLDTDCTFPSWVWGQEYPWNILQHNSVNDNDNVVLPRFVTALLTDGNYINPPSDLSLFGLDFTSTASWLFVKKAADRSKDVVSFDHSIDYTVASHGLRGEGDKREAFASLNNHGPLKLTSSQLDLSKLALDALPTHSAVVGFRKPHLQRDLPDASIVRFISDDNELLIETVGFSKQFDCNLDDTHQARIIVFFKLADDRPSVSLQMRHWVEKSAACRLSIKINDYQTPDKYVTNPFEFNGEDNLTTVSLRHQDFSSQNYCDFLEPGLNRLEIGFSKGSEGPCVYRIDALAIS